MVSLVALMRALLGRFAMTPQARDECEPGPPSESIYLRTVARLLASTVEPALAATKEIRSFR
jgi:hypothetical protein